MAATGMMVPASARELNYRGQADDGFVHRMLLACPEEMPPFATLEGVPDELTAEYKRRLTRLFDPPPDGERMLTFEPAALRMVVNWANTELYPQLRALRDPQTGTPVSHPHYPDADAPAWLASKYRKLVENCLRLCLVLHELWRVADGADAPTDWDEREEWEPHPRDFYGTRIEFRSDVVDRLTAERAIAVVDYFRHHIGPVQELLGGEEVDDVDRAHTRLRRKGIISVRETIHRTTYKTAERVLALFAEWVRRGYGEIQHPRKNQSVFKFAED